MQPILLLHGAIGAAAQLSALSESLGKNYKVYSMSFSGHGGNAFPEKPFSISLFAEEVLAFMDSQGLERVNIFGYSMGGYVALYLAKHHSERVLKIVTLATKFHWDEATAAKELQMLNADKIEAKLPAFAQALKERHAPQDWKAVLHKTGEMLSALGQDNTLKAEDYAAIQTPILILLGDRDKMVSLEETVTVYKSLPVAAMGMLPDTQHPIEQADNDTLAYFIHRFIAG